MKSFDAPRREQVLTVVLCAAFCLTVLSGRILAHRIGGSAGFWPANAFLVAALFMSSRRAAVGVLIFCGLTATALQVWLGDPPIRVLTYIQWSLIEAVVATLLLKVALGPRALLRTPGGFLRIQLLAVLPACAISSLGLILQIHAAFSPAAGSVLRKEFVAHLLGMATALPALLLMIQKPLMEPRRSPWEMPLMLAALALIVALMMHQAGPMAFVISPALMFAAFRMGPRGAALANVILSIVALPVVASGGGPFSLHPEWDLHQRVAIYQLTVLSSLFGVTLGAFMLAQQARLRCLLERRAQAARAARRRAIDAGRAKTDFLATMSHEVRTPMNSILGFTDLLMRDPRLQPEARRHVGLIAQAGATLMVLLDDILDLSKVEAGQVALNPEPVDLAEVGRGALDIVSQAAKAKGLSLTFRMDDDLNGPYRADSVRLRQILLNLLSNAVKFTAHGGVSLAILPVGETSVRFEVRDTGIGIGPDLVPRLFARFSQADSSISRTYGGTGLGLAICKGLVEGMGGRIGVDSAPGAGSTFWFELPLRTAAGAPASSPAPEPAAPAMLQARVLVVDDHPVNRQLAQTLLELLGCEVEVAEGGEEAVRAARGGGYDAILMDVHMPHMDGLAATRAIRGLESASGRTPIIAMTADVMPHNIELCRRAGMVDHIAKPIQIDVMHAVLDRCLGAPQNASIAAA